MIKKTNMMKKMMRYRLLIGGLVTALVITVVAGTSAPSEFFQGFLGLREAPAEEAAKIIPPPEGLVPSLEMCKQAYPAYFGPAKPTDTKATYRGSDFDAASEQLVIEPAPELEPTPEPSLQLERTAS